MIIEFEGVQPKVDPTAFIAATAVLIGDVEVGPKASIWYGAVLRGDCGKIVIGEGACIQDNCVVHGGTVVGKFCHVTHGVILHTCTLENYAFIGMNSTVLDGATVGSRCMVAAGSIIKEKAVIPGQTVVAGVPAEVKKEISGSSLQWIEEGPRFYVELAQRYIRAGLDSKEEKPS